MLASLSCSFTSISFLTNKIIQWNLSIVEMSIKWHKETIIFQWQSKLVTQIVPSLPQTCYPDCPIPPSNLLPRLSHHSLICVHVYWILLKKCLKKSKWYSESINPTRTKEKGQKDKQWLNLFSSWNTARWMLRNIRSINPSFPFRLFGYIASKIFNYLAFQSFDFVWAYLMKIIPETRRAH